MKESINIQEYINSGILEQFALGFTSPEQNVEIGLVLKQYPELQKELTEIEKSLELFARQYSKPMPDYLKNRVLKSIEFEKSIKAPTSTSGRFINFILYLAIPLLLLSTIYLWKQNQDQQKQIQQLNATLNQAQLKANQDSIALVECKSLLNDLKDKDQYRILLKGTPKSPQAFAAVYYDTLKQRTYLDVMNLPPVPPEKQYQLWAIVSGKPVDLGVFDLVANKATLKEIKFVAQAQAFAITLEPQGGKSTPSMDQMFVMGGI